MKETLNPDSKLDLHDRLICEATNAIKKFSFRYRPEQAQYANRPNLPALDIFLSANTIFPFTIPPLMHEAAFRMVASGSSFSKMLLLSRSLSISVSGSYLTPGQQEIIPYIFDWTNKAYAAQINQIESTAIKLKRCKPEQIQVQLSNGRDRSHAYSWENINHLNAFKPLVSHLLYMIATYPRAKTLEKIIENQKISVDSHFLKNLDSQELHTALFSLDSLFKLYPLIQLRYLQHMEVSRKISWLEQEMIILKGKAGLLSDAVTGRKNTSPTVKVIFTTDKQVEDVTDELHQYYVSQFQRVKDESKQKYMDLGVGTEWEFAH